MNCELAVNCNLVNVFLKCSLQADTIDDHLQGVNLKGIHTYKQDFKTQNGSCSLWRAEIKTYPELKRQMVEYLNKRRPVSAMYKNRHHKTRQSDEEEEIVI